MKYSLKKNIEQFNELERWRPDPLVVRVSKREGYRRWWNERTEALYLCGDIDDVPTDQYSANLKLIIIEEGVDSIRKGALCNNKCKSLFIPDSVTFIDEDAIGSDTLEYLEIPLHLGYILESNRFPLIDEIHIRENKIVAKSSNPDFDFEMHSRGIKLYLEKKDVDFNRSFYYLEEIENINIGEKVETIDISCFGSRFFKKVFVNPKNTYFKCINNCVLDKSNKLYFMKESEHPIISSAITDFTTLPAIINYGNGHYTKFDISMNPLLHENFNVVYSDKKIAIYIPDEGEINITGCKGFIPNVLARHMELEKLIICCDNDPDFDIASLEKALNEYVTSMKGYRCFRVNPLNVIVPTTFTSFKKCTDQYLCIDIADIESPDTFLA